MIDILPCRTTAGQFAIPPGDGRSTLQGRHFAKPLAEIAVKLSIRGVVAVVKGSALLVRHDLSGLLYGTATCFLDAAPDARSDARKEGDAIRGAFGGVGEDDRLVVNVGLELAPESGACSAAGGADFADG